jgi:serine/threonine-protein phosphatase with EF-hands
LYTIFDLNGLPSSTNSYLFNGDFVDRGPQQCEVFLTLLYGLVLYCGKENSSNSFFLNRGNHEDYGCSIRFGFKEEVMTKYCLFSKLIMKKCVEAFALLPVATIVTQQAINPEVYNQILVVHGGVSNNFDLDLIKNINRIDYPNVDGTSVNFTSEKEIKEVTQLQDLFWSDPMQGNGCIFNKQRHIAKQFGRVIN